MSYTADGEYVPDQDVAWMYDQTPQSQPQEYTLPTNSGYDTSGAFDTYLPAIMGSMSGGQASNEQVRGLLESPYSSSSSGGQNSPGVASGVGDLFAKAAAWFSDDKTGAKGAAAMTIGGSFIKGLFSYNDDKRRLKAIEKSSDASMLNAQTNVEVTNKKFANASSISSTNFGAKGTAPKFSNKLGPRQTRAGYPPGAA